MKRMSFYDMAERNYYHVCEGRHYQYRIEAAPFHGGPYVSVSRRLKKRKGS